MIVTGDRDVFQLIDDDGLIKVMATARGITDTKIYDRQAVIDRYGIPPELIPDFYGLKGDTSDNIPGVPGIGDKTASELIQSFGSLEDVLGHIDEISGPKRKQNLLEHAEDARVSKRLRRCSATSPWTSTSPPRPRASPTARACARSFASTSCATRCAGWRRRSGTPTSPRRRRTAEVTLSARVRAGAPAELAPAGLAAGRAVRGGARQRAARGRAVRRGPCVALRGGGRRRGARRRVRRAPRRSWRELASAPVVAHDAKALGVVPPGLVHDTLLGAYLLEPARRGYPFAELCEERGLASDLEDPLAADAVLLGALADWQREQIAERGLEARDARDRAAAGERAARHGAAGRAPERRAPGARSPRACARRSRCSNGRSSRSPARSS